MESSKRVANNLVALSSAAILAVYAAGYLRTKSAADRLTEVVAERRASPSEVPARARLDLSDRNETTEAPAQSHLESVSKAPISRSVASVTGEPSTPTPPADPSSTPIEPPPSDTTASTT